jgi:hypothetical protein
MDWTGQPKPLQRIAGERRQDHRYDIDLELRWKLIRRKRVVDSGTGRTIDLSSGGVLFEAARELAHGFNVELSIAWPVLLHNVAPMQLVIIGKIVRVKGSQTAIRTLQHEFRTTGVPAEHRGVLAAATRTPVPWFNESGGLNRLQ